jgi:hypothetical protein
MAQSLSDMRHFTSVDHGSFPGSGNGQSSAQSINDNGGSRYDLGNNPTSGQRESILPGDVEALIRDVVGPPKEEKPVAKPESDAAPTTCPGTRMESRSPSPPPLPMQPQSMLFGSSENDLDNLISKRSLQALPEHVLRKLATKGKMEGSSILMKNYDQVESMVRLGQYLDCGRYTPFKPPILLEYTLPNGNTASWGPPTRGSEALMAVPVTDNTHKLLEMEVDFYFFAKEVSHDELRRASVRNMIEKYPKSNAGVWMLVERAFLQSHPADTDLREYIFDLINANRSELIAMPRYESLMRKLTKARGVLGQTLFNAYLKSVKETHQKLAELTAKDALRSGGADKPLRDRMEIGHLLRGYGTTPSKPPSEMKRTSPTTRFSTAPLPLDRPDSLEPSHLPLISEAINNGRLLVAKKTGYGTLAGPGVRSERNKDFRFAAGELLMLDTSQGAASSQGLLVYNSRGERGYVLRRLIVPIPPTMGIDPCDRGTKSQHFVFNSHTFFLVS